MDMGLVLAALPVLKKFGDFSMGLPQKTSSGLPSSNCQFFRSFIV